VDREEKLGFARLLTARLLAAHGEDRLVALGVQGSLARGDDTEGSDLNLAVITADPEVHVPDRTLSYQGTVVDLAAITADAYLEQATQIGPLWPVAADQYLHTLALHDPTGYFQRLRQAHQEAVAQAPGEAFLEAAGYDLVRLLALDAKARAAELYGDVAGALLAVREALVFAALVVGLVTRTPYRNDVHAVRTVAGGAGAPPGLLEPYRRALSPLTDPATAVIALGRVRDALVELARREGIPFEADDPGAFL
jgi:predicted nucleotidyltransferase